MKSLQSLLSLNNHSTSYFLFASVRTPTELLPVWPAHPRTEANYPEWRNRGAAQVSSAAARFKVTESSVCLQLQLTSCQFSWMSVSVEQHEGVFSGVCRTYLCSQKRRGVEHRAVPSNLTARQKNPSLSLQWPRWSRPPTSAVCIYTFAFLLLPLS